MMSTDAKKFPRSVVGEVFLELWRLLDPADVPRKLGTPEAKCDLLCAVGGFRRQKKEMKDLELLFIPRIREEVDPGDLFGGKRTVDITARLFDHLIETGLLAKRLSVTGIATWGGRNKLAVHVPSGLPVDLFAADAVNWWNRLVVTTGSMESNIRVASAARVQGWEWEVFQPGFVPLGGTWETSPSKRVAVKSEREVFEFVKLPFLPPEKRV